MFLLEHYFKNRMHRKECLNLKDQNVFLSLNLPEGGNLRMLFNKLKFILIFAALLVTGLAFATTRATAQTVAPVLSVPDEDEDTTNGIQVYGIRAEAVDFELTITFQNDENPPVSTPVTGFDATDVKLYAAESSGVIVNLGATASAVRSNTSGSVYTTTVTVKENINKVVIQVPEEVATTPPTLNAQDQLTPGALTAAADQIVVNIVRSTAPPLTLSEDRSVSGTAPFAVTLTSTTPITLTRVDLKVTGGSIDNLSSDTAKRVWRVTIRPGVGINQLTVEPADNGTYIFPKGTFTVDTTGPVATITTIPIGGGVYSITIVFNEPLQTGATLLASKITVIGASIGVLNPIPATNSYVATLIPNPVAATVTVQINAGAVADAGGVPNVATPSPAHTFRVAATAAPPGTTPGQGTVTISEIMFATDGGANEIQWIELSNSSKTAAVALDAGNGWELRIENYNDPRSAREPRSGTINFKDSGGVNTISPNQTVLIVSANGRNSDRIHFVTTRVFRVYPALAAEFGMRTPRDPFLHPTEGFHIKLVDGRNNLVDEVGNLDGRIRTADEPAWELPNGWTEDEDRTSIIRGYREYNQRIQRYTNKGAALDGTLQEAWIRAADTSFLYLLEKNIETWYGIRTDHGSPGVRAGQALPVQLSQFRPDHTETGTVVIQWTTESEMDNAGFNILRSQTRMGEFKVINAQLIPGAGTTAERNTYTWTDTTANPNVVYYYQIEDVSFDGEHQTLATVRLRGLISAKGKLTTQWGELKHSRD